MSRDTTLEHLKFEDDKLKISLIIIKKNKTQNIYTVE